MRNTNYLSIGIAIAADGATLGAAVVEARLAPPLRVLSVERQGAGPGYADAVRWWAGRAADVRAWSLFDTTLRDRRHVLVETSHFTAGRPLFEALWYSDARRKWEPRLSAVELVGVDLATPQRDGWRAKVSRREVVATLLTVTTSGCLDLSGVDRSLARDLRAQLEKLTQWRDRDDPEGTGGELAIAMALAVWDAAKVLRRLEMDQPLRTA